MRAERPSLKNSLERRGMYLGWLCMSCRHPATASNIAAVSIRTKVWDRCLIGHLPNIDRTHAAEELLDLIRAEFRVCRFDDQVELVLLPVVKEAFNVEDRMVGQGQAVQPEHADHSGKRS